MTSTKTTPADERNKQRSEIYSKAIERLNIQAQDLGIDRQKLYNWRHGRVKLPVQAFVQVLDYENRLYGVLHELSTSLGMGDEASLSLDAKRKLAEVVALRKMAMANKLEDLEAQIVQAEKAEKKGGKAHQTVKETKA